MFSHYFNGYTGMGENLVLNEENKGVNNDLVSFTDTTFPNNALVVHTIIEL